jgi:ADP-heptose:LPS heptosyltransferase
MKSDFNKWSAIELAKLIKDLKSLNMIEQIRVFGKREDVDNLKREIADYLEENAPDTKKGSQ